MKSWFLLAFIAVFATISLITIGSVRSDLLVKQAVFFLVGGGVFFATSRVPFYRWLEWRWWLHAGVLVLLLLPLALGHSTRNTSRWIELGSLNLQPSQLALPLIGLSSVWLLARTKLGFKQILVFFLSLIPTMVLIFIAPDLSTTLVFTTVLLGLLWYAGATMRHLSVLALLGVTMLVLSWALLLKPYQRERMITFIAGTQRADQQHYNAAQALIAVGGGAMLGTGWGSGSQAQLQFLPEPQTDFIFSSFAQEFGFIGSALLVLLLFLTSLTLFHYARLTKEKAASLYLTMTATALFLQGGINIGMNIGLLPITGVTLPLVSYGGSSIVSVCLMFGICSSILRRPSASTVKIII